MNLFFDQKIKELADIAPRSIYAVGGYVRNFLIDGSLSRDLDLAAAIPAQEFENLLRQVGITPLGVYKRTGTVLFKCGDNNCEYTAFRKEVYAKGGGHTPVQTQFTDDIFLDSTRRDFKCNAVYYDIKNQIIVDPLGGVEDIKNKVLDTVVDSESVFSHDGLRLMRLARFCGELGFSPTEHVEKSAKLYANNILDISVERVYDELKRLLVADTKYKFSPKDGHYLALKMLDKVGVLDLILPEITLGRNMPQRKDYHKYDVLEHTFRTVLYASTSVRLAALLHDIGKPKQYLLTNQFYGHDKTGVTIAKQLLKRLKVDNKTADEVLMLIGTHMYDIGGEVTEKKLRRFLVKNHSFLPLIFSLRQADFSAGKDDLSTCPVLLKWERLLEQMQHDGTPFSLKDLNITAHDLIELGIFGENIGKTLSKLLDFVVVCPKDNQPEKLKVLAKSLVGNKN